MFEINETLMNLWRYMKVYWALGDKWKQQQH